MSLIKIISEDIVKVPLTAGTKNEVIKEMIDILEKAGKITDVDQVYDAVQARETLASTGLEKGIAVPHAKTLAVKSLTVAIGLSPQGINFDSMDGEPAHVFFLLLAPPDQSGPHIEALAEIARMSRSQSLLNLLLSAKNAKDVIDLFLDE